MRIAACIKLAVDEAELKVDPDGRPLLEGSPSKMSTFDKNALEEALRLRSAQGGEVVVFTAGGPDSRKSLKEALAMGCDRGFLVTSNPSKMDALGTSELLSTVLGPGHFDLILCSEGSSDIYTGLVPPMLAEILGLPFVGYARKLEVSGTTLRAERSLEDSVEEVEAALPAVVSVVSEINEPRYPTLIQIMQASKKPIEEGQGAGPTPDARPQVTVLSMSAKTTARKHVLMEGSPAEVAAKLLDVLEKEGVAGR